MICTIESAYSQRLHTIYTKPSNSFFPAPLRLTKDRALPYNISSESKTLYQGAEMDLTSRRLPTKIDLMSFEKVVTKRSTCLFRHQRGYSIG